MIVWFHNFAKARARGLLLWLMFVSMPAIGYGAENPPFLVTYTQVRKPSQLVPQMGVDLPSEFSKYPFSIYHVFNADHPDALEPVVCVPLDSASVWNALAKRQNWVAFEQERFLLYFQAESSLGETPDVQTRIVDHLRYTPDSVASGGLMSDWKAYLAYIRNSSDLRNAFLEAAFPFLEGRSESLGAYGHWMLDQLSNLESLVWEVNSSRGSDHFALSIFSQRGTRLHRLFSQASGAIPKLFGFVADDTSNLQLGWLSGANSSNYFNYLFNATADVEDASFRAIHEKLDALDAGIFDRWDGSWALWNPNGGSDRLLALGGRFQPSDLMDLFDMLSEVPWEVTSGSLKLDGDNSVVGFSRVRSLQWFDEDETSFIGTLVPNRVYFGIANGFLVISESDSALMELIFTLNARKPLKESALKLLEEETQLSVRQYREEEMVRTVTLNKGRMVLKQSTTPDWFSALFRKATKNLAN